MDELLGILGWPRAELARRVGVSATTVTRWGKHGEPRTVLWGLRMAVRLKQISDAAVQELALPARRVRGRHVARDRDPYGLAGSSQAILDPGDYRKLVEAWEDTDQDSGGYGRG